MTATRAALLELATRVEQASGPDEHLDCAIALATGWEPAASWVGMLLSPAGEWGCLPSFTASLDAALTLVPAGWDWCLSRGSGEPAIASMAPAMGVDGPMSTAATPALALCAAALRALAAEAPQ